LSEKEEEKNAIINSKLRKDHTKLAKDHTSMQTSQVTEINL
jgi:hypothetical protein